LKFFSVRLNERSGVFIAAERLFLQTSQRNDVQPGVLKFTDAFG
jgi:hypothetical protein